MEHNADDYFWTDLELDIAWIQCANDLIERDPVEDIAAIQQAHKLYPEIFN